ncbi:hypothetical protein K432DRAFT_385175 [Lepidopterella palustris CBS 459.81]|uniref:Uncharacterized protein n=1 Tax=Lepidopterella palustris CBS 459.81 TaxID=1314670 RepID=A0A8E2E3K1_9PEZI|nr:hypothetical protein K432DRAFT_385175 [Lepidopterella palustris CBS 459.81]
MPGRLLNTPPPPDNLEDSLSDRDRPRRPSLSFQYPIPSTTTERIRNQLTEAKDNLQVAQDRLSRLADALEENTQQHDRMMTEHAEVQILVRQRAAAIRRAERGRDDSPPSQANGESGSRGRCGSGERSRVRGSFARGRRHGILNVQGIPAGRVRGARGPGARGPVIWPTGREDWGLGTGWSTPSSEWTLSPGRETDSADSYEDAEFNILGREMTHTQMTEMAMDEFFQAHRLPGLTGRDVDSDISNTTGGPIHNLPEHDQIQLIQANRGPSMADWVTAINGHAVAQGEQFAVQHGVLLTPGAASGQMQPIGAVRDQMQISREIGGEMFHGFGVFHMALPGDTEMQEAEVSVGEVDETPEEETGGQLGIRGGQEGQRTGGSAVMSHTEERRVKEGEASAKDVEATPEKETGGKMETQLGQESQEQDGHETAGSDAGSHSEEEGQDTDGSAAMSLSSDEEGDRKGDDQD